MYIKWIVCDVKKNLRQEFSFAQQKWETTKNATGFIGQVGGWNLKNNYEACLVSFWTKKESLLGFMKNLHDEIFFKNQQKKTYEAVSVTYFKSKLDMPGAANDLVDAIEKAKLVRIADCLVKTKKVRHFENVQKTIWIPEMKKAKGMLGGKFSLAEDKINRYLVTTFWDSVKNHRNHVEKNLPV